MVSIGLFALDGLTHLQLLKTTQPNETNPESRRLCRSDYR